MPISIADLLSRLGGADAAASLTGVSAEAIRKWRSGNAIPARHWPAIMAATGLAMEDMPGAAEESGTPPGATAALVLADGTVFWAADLARMGYPSRRSFVFRPG